MTKNTSTREHIRKVSSGKQNASIDRIILENIRKYGGRSADEISERIKELDSEWDVERVLDLNMSALALFGITGSLLFSKYSIILPILLLLFFIWHAIVGWCPPIPVIRFFKVRTRAEIDREKYALKALRGDFRVSENKNDPNRIFEATRKV